MENEPYNNYPACEALFRLLKRTAEEQKNMPLVSDWHFKEKLMKLKTLLDARDSVTRLDRFENTSSTFWERAKAWGALSFKPPYRAKLRLTGL